MLILASASPRRRELLAQAGLAFISDSAGVPETLGPGETAADFVLRLAEEKAQAVWARHKVTDTRDEPLIVIGADTCVLCAGEVLGKPRDQTDARRMLQLLSGRFHQVLSGITVLTRAETFADVEITQVYFDQISDREMVAYLASQEPLDKAGAYGIQGYAARWIPKIEGDYFNVVGLPIARTVALLNEAYAKLGLPAI